MTADRACNAYLFAIREHADDNALAKIEEALQPPKEYRLASGAPVWYGDDDDAWQEWSVQV